MARDYKILNLESVAWKLEVIAPETKSKWDV